MGASLQTVKPAPERFCLQAPRWQVIAMIPCFAVVLGGHLFGAYAAYYNIDGSFPHPVAFGLVVSAQCLFFLCLGAYYFIAAERERIWIFDDAILQRGVIFTRRIEFKDILALSWRQHTFRLVIEGPHTRISIWLNTYPFAQQQQVIEFFRSTVPRHLHKNYRPFRRVFGNYHCRPRGLTQREARHITTFCAALLFVAAAGFVAAWYGGAEGFGFELAVMCALAGAGERISLSAGARPLHFVLGSHLA